MKKIIFATHNQNKVTEVKAVFSGINIISLSELNYTQEIEETEDTFSGNALLKARQVFDIFNSPVFADDSGLTVDVLDGAPGVRSARYAGEDKNHQKNNDKLLEALYGKTIRNAQFRTVIAFKNAETEMLFEGIVEGTIALKSSGSGGFGYDPLFIPKGYDDTFAALPKHIKLALSHRSIAIQKLHAFLNPTTKC